MPYLWGSNGEEMNTLQSDFGRLDRYQITFEKLTGVWRILDIQNEEVKKIKNLDLEGIDADIPDDSPAVTILTDSMFSKLIATAIKEGVLDESVVGLGRNSKSDNAKDEEIKSLQKEIEQYKGLVIEQSEKIKNLTDTNFTAAIEIDDLKKEINKNSGSESYKLKSQIISTLSKLAIGENINEVERISRG